MNIFTYGLSGNKEQVTYESFTFHGGEEHIRFNPNDFKNIIKVEIFERLTSSSRLIRLMMTVDALNRLLNEAVKIELISPYFPYARQDRVCVNGEALSVSVVAKLINSLNFSKVTIWDAHSDVSLALLDRVVNITQVALLKNCKEISQKLSEGELILVSPDAGATKKTIKIAESFDGIPQVIQAQKLRDLKTGKIIMTEVSGNVEGKRILIVDDICDGGRTFIELAKELKIKGAIEVSLFITHGIFSKGLKIFDGLIDNIYTTNSFRSTNEYFSKSAVNLKIIEM